ncbi:hypothetical protein NECAME_16454 [Necator americanus]|uniref:Uncharacterized protein n=1 Tax=Necator americanus TaxID=51031 RepID=W2TYN6_NECAM|nr:hypothetical protein NECAME_16454 [Necator americanus]ETN86147.1 hypothetical protein NECAME_16454 [Necator americanus]
MLPALIDSTNVSDIQASARRRLLHRAHQQIRRGAAGFKDIAERAHEAGMRHVEKFQKEPPLCFIIMHRAYHKYGLKIAERAHEAGMRHVEKFQKEPPLCFIIMHRAYHKYGLKRISRNRSRRVVEIMARAFNNSEYLIYIKGNTTLRLQKLFNE